MTREELVQTYTTLLHDVRRMQEAVELADRDIRLVHEQGYRLHAAIDFHELYNFIVPDASDAPRHLERHGEAARRAHMSEDGVTHAARAYLLGQTAPLGRLVLLPPYSAELASFLLGVAQGATRSEVLRKTSAENLFGQGSRWPAVEDASNLLLRYLKGSSGIERPAVDHAWSTVTTFMQKHLKDVLLVLSGVGTNAIRTIRSLRNATSGGIRDLEGIWPSRSALVDEVIQSPASEWFDRFSELRPERAEPNFRDAKALDLLYTLNATLLPEHECLILVSDSPALWSAADELPWHLEWAEWKRHPRSARPVDPLTISETGAAFPVVRPLSYLIALLLARAPEPDAQLKRLSEMRANIAEFVVSSTLLTVNSPADTATALSGLSDDSLQRAAGAAQKCSDLRNQFLNLRLAAERDAYIGTLLDGTGDRVSALLVDWRPSLEALLRYLGGRDDVLQVRVEELSREVDAGLREEVDQLGDAILDGSPGVLTRVLAAVERASAASLRLRVRDAQLSGLLTTLVSGPTDVQEHPGRPQALAEILRLIRDPKTPATDRRLIKIILLHAMHRYRAAEGLARLALYGADPAGATECRYAIGISLWRQRRWGEAEEVVGQLIRESNDPEARLLNLQAIIRGSRLRRRQSGSKDDLPQMTREYEALLIQLEKARDKSLAIGDLSLASSAENNFAYYCALSPLGNALIFAEHAMDRLRGILKEAEWPIEFVHTAGVVALRRARDTNDPDAARAALAYFMRAEDDARGAGAPHPVRKDLARDVRDARSLEKRLAASRLTS